MNRAQAVEWRAAWGCLMGAVMSWLAPMVWAGPQHDADVGARARYAEVDAVQSGRAASLLLRGNVASHWTATWQTFVELDAVGTFLRDQHHDGVRLSRRALIQDVPGLDLNQAFVAWRQEDLSVRLGRQRITVDNQRFMGGNAFWQNEQTFDALLTEYRFSGHSRWTYSYIANANRIFGDRADKNDPERPPAFYGDHAQRTHLGHLEWNGMDYSRFTAYAYRMDNQDMPSASHATYGASYTLHYKSTHLKYRAQLELAEQKRFALMPNKLSYVLWDAGIGVDAWELIWRHEILDADQGRVFITPLGSTHQFEGWAGVASGLADAGIQHTALGLVWRASPFRTELFHRQFHQALTDRKIGDEWNADLSYRPQRKQRLSLRFAQFEPADHSPKTRKIFLDYAYNL